MRSPEGRVNGPLVSALATDVLERPRGGNEEHDQDDDGDEEEDEASLAAHAATSRTVYGQVASGRWAYR